MRKAGRAAKNVILTLCLLCVELKKKVVRGPLSGSSFRQLTHVTEKSTPDTSSESLKKYFLDYILTHPIPDSCPVLS